MLIDHYNVILDYTMVILKVFSIKLLFKEVQERTDQPKLIELYKCCYKNFYQIRRVDEHITADPGHCMLVVNLVHCVQEGVDTITSYPEINTLHQVLMTCIPDIRDTGLSRVA